MARILVFGDSIAHGTWDEIGGGWTNRLNVFCMKEELKNPKFNYSVYNLGISGDNSENLLERFELEIKHRLEDDKGIIVFAIGLNDSQIGDIEVDINKFEKNIEELIKIAIKYSSKIVFVGLNPVDESKTNPIPWDKNMFYKNERIKI